MVKHLACYLTDHKQKSINSSWLEIAIWPQIWSLAPFILNVFKCPFKSLIWTPPHPHRPFSRREILNSAPKCILWWLRAKKLFVHRNIYILCCLTTARTFQHIFLRAGRHLNIKIIIIFDQSLINRSLDWLTQANDNKWWCKYAQQ